MKNKKWIYPLLIMGLLILTNCKKDSDSSSPTNLTGTEWKSAFFGGGSQYFLLKFTGKTTVQMYENFSHGDVYNLEFFEAGSYSLDGNNISFVWDDAGRKSGVINGNTLTLYSWYGDDEVFTKQ